MSSEKYMDLLEKLLEGKLTRQDKKELLAAVKKDPALAEQYHLAEMLLRSGKKRSAVLKPATTKLSKVLLSDFIKSKKSKLLRAVRTYDSSFLPLPEGVRPASVDTRSLKYKLGDFTIELTVYPITVDSIELIGRIEGTPDEAEISIQYQSGAYRETISVDSFNLFRFERVPAKRGSLQFTVNGAVTGFLDIDV